MTGPRKNLIFNRDFVWFLGAFQGSWATLELVTSYGIGKFLKIDFEQAHIVTSGMEFGRKAVLLRNLVYRSDDTNKKAIIRLLGKIQNESKRNVFAHGYIISDSDEVTFIDRSRGGDYQATEHTFTLKQFADHVTMYTKWSAELQTLLGAGELELHRFAKAALSANTKSTKSPTPPNSKA